VDEETCGYSLNWWDGDAEGTYTCTLPEQHAGLHWGQSEAFDDNDIVECLCPHDCLRHPAALPLDRS
jgi:hypothetical protein